MFSMSRYIQHFQIRNWILSDLWYY